MEPPACSRSRGMFKDFAKTRDHHAKGVSNIAMMI